MGLKNKNILFVGAHPDDIELGCGGTLLKHIERGDSVICLILTNGEKGNRSRGKEECISSLNFLGVKEVFFGDFSDGYLKHNHKTVNFIESIIKKFNIQRVYTHDVNDTHQDHRNCSLSVSSAARRVGEVILFAGPSTTNLFDPHYFIEISEQQINKKINALNHYHSQLNRPYFDNSILKKIAELNGSKCNVNYAEAFSLNHIFIGGEDV